MDIEQLVDRETSTYSYLLWDRISKEAALIDSVKEQFERDIRLIQQLDLQLKYALETHIHADHITGSGQLRNKLGCQIAMHQNSQSTCADILLTDNDSLSLGIQVITAIDTPGHTNTDISYHIQDAIFTGDALLINGCGRTDFQSGDAKTLYLSVTKKLFVLEGDTIVYPGHDYNGFTTSTIGREKIHNSRLGHDIMEAQFISIMDGLMLAPPKQIDIAVSSNQRCGM